MGRPRRQPVPVQHVEALTGVSDRNAGTALLREFINEAEEKGYVTQILADALGAETAQKVACPECGTEFKPTVPDVKKQLDALLAIYERTEGKAGERPPEAMQIVIERPPLR